MHKTTYRSHLLLMLVERTAATICLVLMAIHKSLVFVFESPRIWQLERGSCRYGDPCLFDVVWSQAGFIWAGPTFRRHEQRRMCLRTTAGMNRRLEGEAAGGHLKRYGRILFGPSMMTATQVKLFAARRVHLRLAPAFGLVLLMTGFCHAQSGTGSGTGAYVVNTGVSANGTLLSGGSSDSHWLIIGGNGITKPTPAVVLTDQLPGNYAQSSDSRWIWANASGVAAFGPPYTFRTTIDLTDFNPSGVTVTGRWGVDNDGYILVNGTTPIGSGEFILDGGIKESNFRLFHGFQITGGFVSGINTLDFVAVDLGYVGGLNVASLVATGLQPSRVVINVASGTQTQAQAGYSTLAGSAPLVKAGLGTLVLNSANTLTGSTAVQQGDLRLADPSALGGSRLVPLSGGTVTLTPGLQTTLGGLAPNAGGLLDLGNGMVSVAAGLSATDLVAALISGLGDGGWSGTSGIVSTAAASSGGSRTVGWLDLGGGSLQVGFAAPGDTNLDWIVDSLDLANFLSSGKLDSGLPATWSEGDFNYDQLVDILDAASFLSSGLLDAGSYNPPAGSIAAVPEPSTWVMGLAGIACGGWQMFRRRRAR
jgi:autotransporter-associated beta strand protein